MSANGGCPNVELNVHRFLVNGSLIHVTFRLKFGRYCIQVDEMVAEAKSMLPTLRQRLPTLSQLSWLSISIHSVPSLIMYLLLHCLSSARFFSALAFYFFQFELVFFFPLSRRSLAPFKSFVDRRITNSIQSFSSSQNVFTARLLMLKVCRMLEMCQNGAISLGW